MQQARTLPVRPDSSPGESLLGYVNRAAALLGVSPLALMGRIGLRDESAKQRYLPGWGISLPVEALERFCTVTRLSKEQVSSMLLSSYDGIAVDLSGPNFAERGTWEYAWQRQWVYFVGTHACPSCLAQSGGVWRLAWKLPWSFACNVHGALLADTCPSCDRRIALETLTAHKPAAPSHLLEPTVCRQPAKAHEGLKGHFKEMCEYPLERIEVQSLTSWPSLIKLQYRIDQALAGTTQYSLGREVSPLEYFFDLRSICAMLLDVGLTEDLQEKLPLTVQQAFALHVENRETSSKHWAYRRAPQSSALMAAITPTAVNLLNTDSPAVLAEKLKPFVARKCAQTDHVNFRFLKTFSFSNRLEGAFFQARDFLRERRRYTLERHREDYTLAFLTSDLVPQLFWEEVYEEQFAELLRGQFKENARRVCSMALLKVARRYSWKEAAEQLGLPAKQSDERAHYATVLLGRAGTYELFRSRLQEFARHLGNHSNRVDYGARRRLLADFAAIDQDDWRDICTRAWIHPGRGTRRRFASVWLWCHLTGGDYRLAPGMAGHDHSTRAEYRYNFPSRMRGQLRDELVEYGHWFLRGRYAASSMPPRTSDS